MAIISTTTTTEHHIRGYVHIYMYTSEELFSDMYVQAPCTRTILYSVVCMLHGEGKKVEIKMENIYSKK